MVFVKEFNTIYLQFRFDLEIEDKGKTKEYLLEAVELITLIKSIFNYLEEYEELQNKKAKNKSTGRMVVNDNMQTNSCGKQRVGTTQTLPVGTTQTYVYALTKTLDSY